jgi:hypothetical protein
VTAPTFTTRPTTVQLHHYAGLHWTGSPSIVVFWLRCVAPIEVLYTTVPVGCDVISGANGTSYVATPLDVGRYLTAQVGANGRNAFALSGAINTSAIL